MAVHEITSSAEYKRFLKTKAKVAVDFEARWSQICQYMGAEFKKHSQKYPGITFLSVDIDDNPDLTRNEGVTAVPTFFFFHNGQKVDHWIGPDPKALENCVRKLNAC